MSNHHIKVIVGMSGGVDSSVSALLLQQQGYHVEGLFMKNWEEDDSEEYCSATEDVADAQGVCDHLGIKLHRVNFAAEYWDRVFEYFLAEYKAGRTPNPDILCNKEVKFRAFLDYAQMLGANCIATGHYARIHQHGDAYQLRKGLDNNKDQSYFLYTLGQQQLKHSLFPVGELEKPQVRALAAEHGFDNHNKKDSTGICFIGERKFKDFLQRYLPAQPGPIKTPEGNTLGQHQGLMYYTLGQRKGIGIGGQHDAAEDAWYVLQKDLSDNTLIVGQGHAHPLLLREALTCQQLHWVDDIAPHMPLQCVAKTRYRQPDQACEISHIDDDCYHVQFKQAQRAITPGQSVVFYDGEVCLGGGVIQ